MTLREAIPANKMDFTTLGMIMQTIGIFYNTLRVEAAEEMAWRLAKFELQSGMCAHVFATCSFTTQDTTTIVTLLFLPAA